MNLPVITISREFGSGGRAIGEKLAKELNIPFYDNERILQVAKETGLSEAFIKKSEQMKATSFLYGLYMNARQKPSNDDLFMVQSKVIEKAAAEGPCVIVGRCADYVLRDRKDLFSLFIHAPLPYRVERAKNVYKVQESNVEEYVKKQDKIRANFYNHISDKKWGDANSFHMALSSVYGVDYAVEILKHAALCFLQPPEAE